MRLIVGLGNPGEKYRNTRHNVGFMVLDTLVSQISNSQFPISNEIQKQQPEWSESKKGKLLYFWFELKGEKIELIKPQTFVNNSGYSIAYVYKKHPEFKTDDMYVVHDDLDIKLGDYKIQKGKGPREHKGLQSIYNSIDSKDFWHVRIGIENREKKSNFKGHRARTSLVQGRQMSKVPPGEAYVLQDFTSQESGIVDKVIKEVVKEMIRLLED